MQPSQRRPLNEFAWWLYVICDGYTTTALLWRKFYSDEMIYVSIVDIIITVFRCSVFTYVCWTLGSDIYLHMLFIPDMLMLTGLVSTISYGFVSNSVKRDTEYYTAANTTGFLVLMLAINCCLRILLKRLQWTHFKVVVYKLLRAYAVFLYLLFILVETRNPSIKGYDVGLFMLFAILNMLYVETVYGEFGAADGTGEMELRFMVGEPAPKEVQEASPKLEESPRLEGSPQSP